MDTNREMGILLNSLQSQIVPWLNAIMIKNYGEGWLLKTYAQFLSDMESLRIKNGEWKTPEDMDLQAQLKFMRGLSNRININNGKKLAIKLLNIRNKYVGHASSRKTPYDEFAYDLRIVTEFGEVFGFKELAGRASELHLAALKNYVGREGENKPLDNGKAFTHPVSGSIEMKDCYDRGLTNSQLNACREIEGFLKSKQQCFILKGYAGTGKTFFIGGLVRYLLELKRNIVLIAPTGRAAHVLSEKTGYNATTIHRAIYSLYDIKEYKDQDNAENVTYKFYFGLRANEYDQASVFIVDEASMISDRYDDQEHLRFGSGRLLRDLMQFIGFDGNDSIKKVIFVGDDAQLPPVHMEHSCALDEKYLKREFNIDSLGAILTDVVRQDNKMGILGNAKIIRNAITLKENPGIEFIDDHEDAKRIDTPEDLVRKYVSVCKDEHESNCTLIVFKNKTVDSYNKIIRDELYPSATSIREGDKIIVLKNNFAFGFPVFNGQFGIIVWASQSLDRREVFVSVEYDSQGKRKPMRVELKFRDVDIAFPQHDGTQMILHSTILENLIEPDNQLELTVLSKALYVDFTKRNSSLDPNSEIFKKMLMDDIWFNALQIRYGYAITCHKSQGGEWSTVFVDAGDKQGVDVESLRWNYTAYTRAKTKLYVMSPISFNILKPAMKNSAIPITTNLSDIRQSGEEKVMSNESIGDAVKNLVVNAMSSVEVSGIRNMQYAVQLTLARGVDEYASLLVSYNKKNMISSIEIRKESSEEFKKECETLKKALIGKSLSFFDLRDELTGCKGGNHPLFNEKLNELMKEHLITVGIVKEYNIYQTRYRFIEGGSHCEILFHFNDKGHYRKTGDSSGSSQLLEKINGILNDF